MGSLSDEYVKWTQHIWWKNSIIVPSSLLGPELFSSPLSANLWHSLIDLQWSRAVTPTRRTSAGSRSWPHHSSVSVRCQKHGGQLIRRSWLERTVWAAKRRATRRQLTRLVPGCRGSSLSLRVSALSLIQAVRALVTINHLTTIVMTTDLKWIICSPISRNTASMTAVCSRWWQFVLRWWH